MTVIRKTRSTVTIRPDVTLKQYDDPAKAKAEIDWYLRLPAEVSPKLVDANPDTGLLVIATHLPVQGIPDRKAIAALAGMLRDLERLHIHHRDVHPGNVLLTTKGVPLLIDWETGYEADAPSYDLHGPTLSVPTPAVHDAVRGPGGYVMWWDSDHRASIKKLWGINALSA